MAFVVGDITIGKFDVILPFGAKAEVYHARYNHKGHCGIDLACPTQTPILAGAGGSVIEAFFDSGAYGYVIKILHQGYLTTYAHLNDIAVKVGDLVVTGQLIGHSNNTGLSDTPHLHFGVAPANEQGQKLLQDNGYGGYIDPQGLQVEWVVKNLSEPVYPQKNIDAQINISSSELSTKEINANNYSTILQFARGNGLDDFLSTENQQLTDLDVNGGQKLNMWISELLVQLRDLPEPAQKEVKTQKKTSFLSRFSSGVRNYIFTQKASGESHN